MPLRFSWRPRSFEIGWAFAATADSCGRKSWYCELDIGTTVCRPSLPPPSWIITRTLSFWTAALLAARTARAKTSGIAAYPDASACAPTPNTSPFCRKSRRESPFTPPSSFIAVTYFSWNSGDARRISHLVASSGLEFRSCAVAGLTTPSSCVRCALLNAGSFAMPVSVA